MRRFSERLSGTDNNSLTHSQPLNMQQKPQLIRSISQGGIPKSTVLSKSPHIRNAGEASGPFGPPRYTGPLSRKTLDLRNSVNFLHFE